MTGNNELVSCMHAPQLRGPDIPQAMYKAVDSHSAKAAACKAILLSSSWSLMPPRSTVRDLQNSISARGPACSAASSCSCTQTNVSPVVQKPLLGKLYWAKACKAPQVPELCLHQGKRTCWLTTSLIWRVQCIVMDSSRCTRSCKQMQRSLVPSNSQLTHIF